jgi:hypothetical protein
MTEGSPGPCIRCGKQGPWDDYGPGRQHPSVVDHLAAEWYFEPDHESDVPGVPNVTRPVCPGCTTWEDRWEQALPAREMIEKSRAEGRDLSENERMWMGEIAEIAAHLKLDREERNRLWEKEPPDRDG